MSSVISILFSGSEISSTYRTITCAILLFNLVATIHVFTPRYIMDTTGLDCTVCQQTLSSNMHDKLERLGMTGSAFTSIR